MAQEIIKLKNDISEAFCAEGKIIGEINENKNKQIDNKLENDNIKNDFKILN